MSARTSAERLLRVTQVRSAIGAKPRHRGTLRALGLGRVGRVAVLPDRPEVRGMVARVPHLVEVVPEGAPSRATPSSGRRRAAASGESNRSKP